MNPSTLRIRTDKATGDLWLVLEKPRQPMQRLKNITNDVLLNLCADLVGGDDATAEITREVKFSDGTACRIVVSLVEV